jgi:hypothetical protein
MSEIDNTQLDDNTATDIANQQNQPDETPAQPDEAKPENEPETEPETVPDAKPEIDLNVFAEAIAAAEERGYKRGCAQVQSMERNNKPQRQTYQVQESDNNTPDSTPTFLAHIRTGFWD